MTINAPEWAKHVKLTDGRTYTRTLVPDRWLSDDQPLEDLDIGELWRRGIESFERSR